MVVAAPAFLSDNMSVVGLVVVAIFALAALASIVKTFSEEFARRSRPRVYSVRRPIDEQERDDPALPIVLMLIMAIIAAAVVLGIKF